ncbi:MAG: hypothetical protein COA86_17825 [Kangiella sp.]|nr:MAG: hypothetical protein COA86_17825 [Kangiella sp.]
MFKPCIISDLQPGWLHDEAGCLNYRAKPTQSRARAVDVERCKMVRRVQYLPEQAQAETVAQFVTFKKTRMKCFHYQHKSHDFKEYHFFNCSLVKFYMFSENNKREINRLYKPIVPLKKLVDLGLDDLSYLNLLIDHQNLKEFLDCPPLFAFLASAILGKKVKRINARLKRHEILSAILKMEVKKYHLKLLKRLELPLPNELQDYFYIVEKLITDPKYHVYFNHNDDMININGLNRFQEFVTAFGMFNTADVNSNMFNTTFINQLTVDDMNNMLVTLDDSQRMIRSISSRYADQRFGNQHNCVENILSRFERAKNWSELEKFHDQLSNVLREYQSKYSSDFDSSVPFPMPSIEGDGERIFYIKTAKELVEEGISMHHCIGSYLDDVYNEVSSIYRYRRGGIKGTIELVGLGKTLRLNQFKGPHNREMLQVDIDYVQSWIDENVKLFIAFKSKRY